MMPFSDFKDMPIPFAAIATDLMTGEEVIMNAGDVPSAIRASMSIPGIFSPVERNGRILVDGGMVNPVPISICHKLGAEKVIAVDLNQSNCGKRANRSNDLNFISIIDETFRIVMNVAQQRIYSSEENLLTLVPPVHDVRILDLHKGNKLVIQGYDYLMSKRNILYEFVGRA